jgi:phosphoribosylamine--glycine ligase
VNDFDAIRKCCIDEKIDLVLVGPEEPLVKGITDFLISDPQLKDSILSAHQKWCTVGRQQSICESLYA